MRACLIAHDLIAPNLVGVKRALARQFKPNKSLDFVAALHVESAINCFVISITASHANDPGSTLDY